MGIDLFKQKCGYEIEGMWLPRVTAITSLVSKFPFSLRETRQFRERLGWGTLVHEFVGNALQEPGESALGQDPQLQPIAEKLLDWQEKYGIQVVDPKRDVERRVHDVAFAYAGTVDLVAQVGGSPALIEIKTGAQLASEYFLQTAAYLHALSGANAETPYKRRWILRIDQYEECEGCLAKQRRRGSAVFFQGGLEICNHQWSFPKAEFEFLELPEYEQDIRAFFAAKELWEWSNRVHLRKIVNYPKRNAV